MKVRLALVAALLLLASACAQSGGAISGIQGGQAQQAQEFLPDGGPPVVNGLYDAHGSCPFEGCAAGDLFTKGPVALRERPTMDSRVVATVPAGEWVSTASSIFRSRPTRGVVVGEVNNLYDSGHGIPVLAIGDVVYAIDYEGEGMTALWRRGEEILWMDEANEAENGVDGGIRWERPTAGQSSPAEIAGNGWWLELVRANGERGWVRDHDNLDCLGVIDAAPRCEERRAARRQ